MDFAWYLLACLFYIAQNKLPVDNPYAHLKQMQNHKLYAFRWEKQLKERCRQAGLGKLPT